MKIMKFSEEEFKRVCFGDHKDFKIIAKITGASSKWAKDITIIVKKHIASGNKYMGSYDEGIYDEDEFYDTELVRCKQIEVKKLEWAVDDE